MKILSPLIVFLMLSISLVAKQLSVRIKTPYACLIDADTKAVLYEKNSLAEIYPASITKIATAVYANELIGYEPEELIRCAPEALKFTSESAKKQSNYTLPPYWLEPDGSMFGLISPLSEVTLFDLMHSILIISGNDSANVLAHYAAGSIPLFMEGVNLWAEKIGCRKTHYKNPHGLHHPEHISCAYDTALMASEAIKHSWFLQIVGMEQFFPRIHNPKKEEFKQSNRLVKSNEAFYYPKAFGIKTGSTKCAGKNIVAGAFNGERRLIVSLHKSPDIQTLYQDAIHLFDAAFAEKAVERVLFRSNETMFTTNVLQVEEKLKGILERDIIWKYYPSEETEVEAFVQWKHLSVPIEQGKKVGHLLVKTIDGRLLFEEPIYAAHDIKFTLREKIVNFTLYRHNRYYLASLVCILIILASIRKRKSRI